MRKTIFSFMLIIIILFTAACLDNKSNEIPKDSGQESKPSSSPDEGDNSNGKPEGNEDQLSDNNSLQAEVIKSIREQLKTYAQVNLPTEIPVEEGEYITATIKAGENNYEVIFFKSNEIISINNEELTDASNIAKPIFRLQGQKMSTQEDAEEMIGFENFSESGAERIDLGYDMTAYQDAGAGSVFTSWNEGRWALTARSLTSESEKGVRLAKAAADFLETNSLPAPHKYGKIHLDTEGVGNIAIWQQGQNIYTIDNIKDAMEMLRIMVEIK